MFFAARVFSWTVAVLEKRMAVYGAVWVACTQPSLLWVEMLVSR